MKKDNTKSLKKRLPAHLQQINLNAAGIDIGSQSHFVAVPDGSDEICVREFKTFTPELHELSQWLKKCGVQTVAMESTGVYWIPVFELLESEGFEVLLVDARHTKNVSGRKTDVLDCQWIQQLHTFGLLQGAFRPEESILPLRAYLRQRSMLIQESSTYILRMQKAFMQMNIQLHHVISDITGEMGMKIVRAIVGGQRDPKILAGYRHARCKNSLEIIEKSLQGNYREEHLFALQQALELYDVYLEKIENCEQKIAACLTTFDSKTEKALPDKKKKNSHCKKKMSFDARSHLHRITGIDLTAIPGIEANTALKIISEIGLDLTRWKNAKQFSSWLGVCPGNKISGGQKISTRSKRCPNQAASALRMAASTLHHNKTALGAFFRRMKTKLGAPKATTAAAHKLAILFFNMLKNGQEYVESGQDYYEQQYKERLIKNLQKNAKNLGYTLVPNAT